VNRPAVEYIKSALLERDFPADGLPEVVMAGRSNVGKSSLINALTGTKGIARTSASPGKTQTINFFRVDKSFYLVDLPGFGFTRAGKAASQEWAEHIQRYFRSRSSIAVVLQLVDARMAPTKQDLQLADWLDALRIPRIVVGTKSDKLSGNGRAVQMKLLSAELDSAEVILSSAKTGQGCREIWKRMADAIQNG
jgi:GTP-binding protein